MYDMERLPKPVLTSRARRYLQWDDPEVDRVHQALLSTVDGERNVIELESVAKAMGLPDWTLVELRAQGLVNWETSAERPS
jgi:hypothetical protein